MSDETVTTSASPTPEHNFGAPHRRRRRRPKKYTADDEREQKALYDKYMRPTLFRKMKQAHAEEIERILAERDHALLKRDKIIQGLMTSIALLTQRGEARPPHRDPLEIFQIRNS